MPLAWNFFVEMSNISRAASQEDIEHAADTVGDLCLFTLAMPMRCFVLRAKLNSLFYRIIFQVLLF